MPLDTSPAGHLITGMPERSPWRAGIIGQALLALAIGTAVVVAAATLVSYQYSMSGQRREALAEITRSAAERAQREQAVLDRVAHQVVQCRRLLAEHLRAPGALEPIPLAKDGARRVVPGDDQPPVGVFVASAAVADDAQLRAVAVARALIAEIGPALADFPSNLTIAVPGRWMVGWGEDAVELASTMLPDDPVLMPAERELLDASGPPHWSRAFLEPASGHWLVAATATLDIAGVGRAAVTQVLPAERILAVGGDAPIADVESIAYDAALRLLADPRRDEQIRRSGGTLTLERAGLAQVAALVPGSGPPAELIADRDGGWLGVSRLRGPDWTLVTVYPEAVVEARARTTATWILVVGLVVIVAQSLLLAAALRLRVGRPLRRLSEAVAALASGASGPSLDVERNDEVGDLSQSFAAMDQAVKGREYQLRSILDRLREREEELRALNADLEQRVISRTEALTASLAERDRAKLDLEAANRELEAFSYSVAHDLRAPLRSIDGFSAALLEDCSAQLDDAGKQHLAVILRQTKRMGELIDDLLALSRLTRHPMSPREVDLSALALAVIESLRGKRPQGEPEWVVAPALHALADPGLARIVLDNLIGNAWKYSAKTAHPRIEIGATPDGAGFFVRDNGAGFDPRFADKLFIPFQRLHSGKEFEGHGIGLATVKRILDRHGGRIWVEAEIDQGATFSFSFSSARHAD